MCRMLHSPSSNWPVSEAGRRAFSPYYIVRRCVATPRLPVLGHFFLALQQSLERLEVGSQLTPDHPLEHWLDESEEAARLCLDARREARPIRQRRFDS